VRQRIERPDPDRILAGLKDFQRDTVEYAFRRLYTDTDSTHRLLVADEVGLGKTLVARGVIARTVDALWERTSRIDVVYICSNADIARQNINRLNVTQTREFASRITLLPTQLHGLKNKKLNFISFTPGTSFDLKSHLGVARERALIYWMLREAWDLRGRQPLHVLRGHTEPEPFAARVRELEQAKVDRFLIDEFKRAVDRQVRHDRERGEKDIRTRFAELCAVYATSRSAPTKTHAHDRRLVVGKLRSLLATTCIQALEPDLIILDEFQRFKHLLDGEDPPSLLARDLFDYSSESMRARVLLLSATPYKMYTVVNEASDEDHYGDFLRTMQFLLNDPQRTERCRELLAAYRAEVFRLSAQVPGRLSDIKDELEALLRKVIVRTERLSATPDRDGMLTAVACSGVVLQAADLRSYRAFQQVARHVDHADIVEYWKSAPYLLNFMEQYKLKQGLREAAAETDSSALLGKVLQGADRALLDWAAIAQYHELEPSNGRLRWLLKETIGRGLWRYLWVPPSLPYYEPRGIYRAAFENKPTKRLIFSSWQVVPRVIAAILSYEAERHMFALHEKTPANTPEARERRRPLLRFTQADERLTGMGVFTLLYPSPILARLGDVRAWKAKGEGRLNVGEAEQRVQDAITARLRPHLERGGEAGSEDEKWYWAAAVLLDLADAPDVTRRWLNDSHLPAEWAGEVEGDEAGDREDRAGWDRHVAELRRLAAGEIQLGRPPADLAQVLAQMALGAPGVCALRALSRICGGEGATQDNGVRTRAGRIALGFRSLYNVPEVMALIRGLRDEQPYWRRALEYGVDGNLSAVLDEYAHVLHESLGLVGHPRQRVATEVADTITTAVSLRTAQLGADEIEITKSRRVQIHPRRLRARFAARFGEQDSEDGETRSRADQVRTAFNSPFWPFVLASTSVGQEGLDFHQYCHAVVHWNLPTNPVDLEQREGRVHRYKGHAVRKNLALRYPQAAFDLSHSDPWEAMFETAGSDRPTGMRDLWPYWLLPTPGGSTIERHVPNLPLSREVAQLEDLRRTLAAYRMVFGQPRQEDLLRYLLAEVPPDRLAHAAAELRIDLAPPAGIDAHRTEANFGPPLPPLPNAESESSEDLEIEVSDARSGRIKKPRAAELVIARQSPDSAREVILSAIPEDAKRRLFLTSFVEGMNEAARVNPESWAVTLFASGGWVVRLNVGMVEALGVHGDGAVRVVVHGPRVEPDVRALLKANGLKLQRGVYSHQPMASPVHLEPPQQMELLPALRPAHLEFIRRAALQVRKKTPYAKFHSPGVVSYLRSEGYSVPVAP